jgi:hypothetical protein
VGRIVGGLSQNKSFQDWMNRSSDTGAGSVPGGYSSGGTTYNNPSAYVAPEIPEFAEYGAASGATGAWV